MSAHRSDGAGLALLEDVLRMALLGSVAGLGLGFLQPLFAVGARLLGDGRVLVADGLSSIAVHDPRTGISGASANGGHGFGSTATLLSDGRVIVAGGMLIDYGHRSDRLADAHLYDPD